MSYNPGRGLLRRGIETQSYSIISQVHRNNRRFDLRSNNWRLCRRRWRKASPILNFKSSPWNPKSRSYRGNIILMKNILTCRTPARIISLIKLRGSLVSSSNDFKSLFFSREILRSGETRQVWPILYLEIFFTSQLCVTSIFQNIWKLSILVKILKNQSSSENRNIFKLERRWNILIN